MGSLLCTSAVRTKKVGSKVPPKVSNNNNNKKTWQLEKQKESRSPKTEKDGRSVGGSVAGSPVAVLPIRGVKFYENLKPLKSVIKKNRLVYLRRLKGYSNWYIFICALLYSYLGIYKAVIYTYSKSSNGVGIFITIIAIHIILHSYLKVGI